MATTFTAGWVRGRRSWLKIQMGSVVCAPAVNVVTTISSNDKANANRAPARRADRISGNVMYPKVWKRSAPRSADASSKLGESRRNRAAMLL